MAQGEFISPEHIKSIGVPMRPAHGVCIGTPEEVARHPESYTGKYLKTVLE